MRPVSSNKNTLFSHISIEENNRIVSDVFNLSDEFSTFFKDVASSLNIKSDEYYLSDMENLLCRDCY